MGEGVHYLSFSDGHDYMRLYFNIVNDPNTWMAIDVNDNGAVKLIGKSNGEWRTTVTLRNADS